MLLVSLHSFISRAHKCPAQAHAANEERRIVVPDGVLDDGIPILVQLLFLAFETLLAPSYYCTFLIKIFITHSRKIINSIIRFNLKKL